MADGTRPSVLTSPTFSNPVITPKSRGGAFADRKTVACPPRTSMLLPKPGYEHERRFESSGSKSRLLDRGCASTDSFDDLGVDMSFEPDGERYDADKESQYESTLPRVRHDSGVSLDDDELLPLDPAKAQLFIEGAADLLDAREAGLSIEGGEQPEAVSKNSVMQKLKTGLRKLYNWAADFASKHKIAIGLALSLIFVAIMCTPAGPAIAAGAGLGVLMSVGLISSSVFFGALLVELMGGLGPDASRVPQPNSGQNQKQSSDKETSKTESAEKANGGDSGSARSTDGTFHVEPQSASQSKPVSKGNPAANVGVQSSAASETQYEQPFSLEMFETWVHEHIGKWAHEDMWVELLQKRSTREAGGGVIDTPENSEPFRELFSEKAIELIDLVKSPVEFGAGASIEEQEKLMGFTEDLVRGVISDMRPTSDYLTQMLVNFGVAAESLGPYFTSDLTEDFLSLQKRPYYEGADRTAPAELRSSDMVRVIQKTLAKESQRIAQEEAVRAVEASQRIAQEEAERARKERAIHIGVNTDAPEMKSTKVGEDNAIPVMVSTEVGGDTEIPVMVSTEVGGNTEIPVMVNTEVGGDVEIPVMVSTEVGGDTEIPVMRSMGVGEGTTVTDDEPTDPNLAYRERRKNVLKERGTKNVTKSGLEWKKPEISLTGNSFHRFLTELDGCANGLDWAMNNSKKELQLKELYALFKSEIRNSEPDGYDKSYIEMVVEEVALVVKARTLAHIGILEKKESDGEITFEKKDPTKELPKVKLPERSAFIETVMEGDLGEGVPKIQDVFKATSASEAEQKLVTKYISDWMKEKWNPSN